MRIGCFLVVVLCACSNNSPGTPDAAVTLVDAGTVDAGSVDAGQVDAGQPDAGQVDAGRVVTANTLCEEFPKVWCARSAECRPGLDRAQCEQSFSFVCTSPFFLNQIAGGTLDFQQVDRCLTDLTEASCDNIEYVNFYGSCNNFAIQPMARIGEACSTTYQTCAQGFCDSAGSPCPRVPTEGRRGRRLQYPTVSRRPLLQRAHGLRAAPGERRAVHQQRPVRFEPVRVPHHRRRL